MDENELKKEQEETNANTSDNVVSQKRGIPIWIWIIIIILIAICLYFLSLINSKKFQISERNGYLIVRKGLFLPYGFSEYIPQDILKREAYSPLKIPDQERLTPVEVDGGELDVALFRIVSGWIEKYLKNENEESLKAAGVYIERAMKLNVSPDDFERYSRLKGELRFKQAKFSFNIGIEMVMKSRDRLMEIKNLSPEFKKDADELIEKIEKIEKLMSADYLLVHKDDIEKIRESVKQECISACVRQTMEQSVEKGPEPAKEEEQQQPTNTESSRKPDEK